MSPEFGQATISSSSEEILGVRYDALSPAVKSYAENVKRQILNIFQEYQATNYREFRDRALRSSQTIPPAVLEHLQMLLQQLQRVLTTQEIPEHAHEQYYWEVRERFGDGLLGMEEVEKAFTLRHGLPTPLPLVLFSPEQRKEALRLLIEKISEPDIQEFLKHISPQQLKKDWLLVLRVPELRSGNVITMKNLDSDIGSEMMVCNEGHLLYPNPPRPLEGVFFTREMLKPMHWQLVSREVIDGTCGLNYAEQRDVLTGAALRLHLDPLKIVRRSAVEVLYDYMVLYRSKRQVMLEQVGDTTRSRSDSSETIAIGYGAMHNGITDGLLYICTDPQQGGNIPTAGAALSR